MGETIANYKLIRDIDSVDHEPDILNKTIKSIAFNNDGSLLAFTFENRIKMYKMNGESVEEPPLELSHGDIDYLGINSLSFHPTLPFLLTASLDSTARLWRISKNPRLSAECVAKTELHILTFAENDPRAPVQRPCYSVAFHPKVLLFATGSGNKTVKLWSCDPDIQAPANPEQEPVVLRPVKTLKNIIDSNVWSVAFHPTMPFLAASDSIYARLWHFSLDSRGPVMSTGPSSRNLQKTQRVTILGMSEVSEAPMGPVFYYTTAGSIDVVISVAFHPREPILVTGAWDNTAKVWCFTADGLVTCLATLVHDRELRHVAFHPDPTNSILATCSHDNKINLWRLPSARTCSQPSSVGRFLPMDAERITTVNDVRDGTSVLYSMAFHPTLEWPSLYLVSGGGKDDGTVKLWKVTEKIEPSYRTLMNRETGSLMNRKTGSPSKFMTISEKRVHGKMGGKNRTRHRRRFHKQQRRRRSTRGTNYRSMLQ